MTTVRMFFSGEQIGPKFEKLTREWNDRVVRATRQAAQDVADKALAAGQEDMIRSEGNFGPRWPAGLHNRIEESGGEIFISFTHDIFYFWVHQKGARIFGKPLMWIPLPGVNPEERGDFFQTSRKGNLLLFQKVGGEIRPLRVAKTAVFVRKRFHVEEAIAEVMRQMPEFYARRAQEFFSPLA